LSSHPHQHVFTRRFAHSGSSCRHRGASRKTALHNSPPFAELTILSQAGEVEATNAAIDALSDDDSDLSEVDEAQFQDFNVNEIAIDEQPIAVDEDNIKLIGRHKRKRDGTEADGEGKRKRKSGRRGDKDKPKTSRRRRAEEGDDGFDGDAGAEVEGKRRRRTAEDGAEKRVRKQRAVTPVDEETLDPEERTCWT